MVGSSVLICRAVELITPMLTDSASPGIAEGEHQLARVERFGVTEREVRQALLLDLNDSEVSLAVHADDLGIHYAAAWQDHGVLAGSLAFRRWQLDP